MGFGKLADDFFSHHKHLTLFLTERALLSDLDKMFHKKILRAQDLFGCLIKHELLYSLQLNLENLPMIPFRKSLAFRIFVISFILLALPLLVDTFIILDARYKDSLKNAKEYLKKAPASRIFVLSHTLQVRKRALVFADYFLQIKEHFPSEPNAQFNTKLQELVKAGQFEDAILLKVDDNETLKVVGYSFEDKGELNNFKSFAFYTQFAAEMLVNDNYAFLFNLPNDKYYFLFGHTIFSDEGKKLGVLIFLVDVTAQLGEFLAPSHGLYTLHYALLIPNAIVLASPSDRELEYSYFFPLSSETIAIVKKQQLSHTVQIKDHPLELAKDVESPFLGFKWKQKSQIGIISPIPETTFLLLSYLPKEQLIKNPFLSFFSTYAVLVIVLLIGGNLAYYFSRRISKPFRKFAEVMEGIQEGDLSLRYIYDPLGFEINTLGLSFNEMIDTLLEKKYLAEEEKIKVEIYDKELKIGQQIQRGLFPTQIPTYHGIEIAQRYLPAKEVGGDFYDIFVRKIDQCEQLTLVIADASGKGVQACFYSLGVRSNLRVFAREYEDVGVIMKEVNSLFYQDSGDTGMFVTLLLGVYDPKSRELSLSSCGHNPPILRRSNGQIEILPQREAVMALGVKKNIDTVSERIKLNQGDVVVFYTDGITETHDENNMLFGEERLENIIREKGGADVNEIAEELITEVRKFQGKTPQHDDITLLLMKVL